MSTARAQAWSRGCGLAASGVGSRPPVLAPLLASPPPLGSTFAEHFAHSGFTGGLNYYRNLDRSWEQTGAWPDAAIHPPSLLIRGENDSMRVVYPIDEAARAVVPNLLGVVDIPECGHWTQQERPEAVTASLLEFLGGL